MYKFTVNHEPVGKARRRITKNGNFTPENTVKFEKIVGWSFVQANKGYKTLTGPLFMEIIAYFETPKSYSKKKRESLEGTYANKKPDFDNIAKSVCDGLNKLAYNDDQQVVECIIVKKYSMNPRVEVTVSEIENFRRPTYGFETL